MERINLKTLQHKILAVEVNFAIFFYVFSKIIASVNLQKKRKIVTYLEKFINCFRRPNIFERLFLESTFEINLCEKNRFRGERSENRAYSLHRAPVLDRSA